MNITFAALPRTVKNSDALKVIFPPARRDRVAAPLLNSGWSPWFAGSRSRYSAWQQTQGATDREGIFLMAHTANASLQLRASQTSRFRAIGRCKKSRHFSGGHPPVCASQIANTVPGTCLHYFAGAVPCNNESWMGSAVM